MKRIYVLHEYGAPSHFYGLEYLANKNGYEIKHREIHNLRYVKKLLLSGNTKIFINISFLLSLIFRSKIKVVLGIAPYNIRLVILMWLLKRHDVYYFTSYTCWDQTVCVHNLNGNKWLLDKWQIFTNSYVKHIFAVSDKTKRELVANNFSLAANITVVNHSYKHEITPNKRIKTLDFIYVGRLVPEKGIIELLDVFKKHKNWNITIIGNGALSLMVDEISKNHDNISYLGYVHSFEVLVDHYKNHSFVILNSQHIAGSHWEELFGLTLIEGMACGCVPIATDHPGPKEIIINNVNGFTYKHIDLEPTLCNIESLNDFEYQIIRKNAVKSSQQYHCKEIAKRWSEVFHV
ncbi:MAG: glycosyltransferase family 4 protein [Rikenellaceae bacterium]